LNRHGRRPLPPQDSVSTKFHHFGTFINANVCVLLLRRCFRLLGFLSGGRALLWGSRLLNGRRCIRHNGLTGPMTGYIRKRQGCQHKDYRGSCGGLAQKGGCTRAAKKGLAATASESCTHIGAFAGLEQNNHNQRDTNDYMQYNQ
jgi:hypothetical protein